MNRLILTLGLAAMDLGWIYPWSLLIASWVAPPQTRPLLSVPSVFGLVVFGALATQAIVRTIGSRRAGQVVLTAAGVVGVLIALWLDQFQASPGLDWLAGLGSAVATALGQPTAPALAAGLAIWLWWRGVRVGTSGLSFEDVDGTFRWGMGGLIVLGGLLAVATSAGQRGPLEAQIAPFMVGFFFVSLLTLALARLESLRTRGRALSLNSQWLAVLVAVAGLLVLTALAIAQLLSFNVLIMATEPLFNVLGRVLLVLAIAIIIPLAYLVELIVYLILRLLQSRSDGEPPQPLQPGEIEEFFRRMFGQGLPEELIAAARAIGVLVLLALGLLLIARAVARWRPGTLEADATAEERDTLWDAARVRQALLAWLRGLFRRRTAAAPAANAAAPDAVAPEPLTLSNVRQLYRRLLRLGVSAGAERPPAHTPYEHLPSLDRALEPGAELTDLTEAYVQARYAEHIPSDAELRDLTARLERVKSRLATSDDDPERVTAER